MRNILVIISIITITTFSYELFARPDVFFTDSDNYGGAYLAHEWGTPDFTMIRFKLTQPIANIRLPRDAFNYGRLKDFLSHHYVYQNPALRREFIRMLDQSFYSQFTTKEFLYELIHALRMFRLRFPRPRL